MLVLCWRLSVTLGVANSAASSGVAGDEFLVEAFVEVAGSAYF